MIFTDKLALLATLLTVAAGIASAIRNLKEGVKPGPDSRTYKRKDPADHQPTGRTAPVQVRCTENTMVVRVRADLYRNGRPLAARQLRLGRGGSFGNCGAIRINDAEFVIEASLHECGSELLVEGDHLIYANTLFFTPVPNPYGIVRSGGPAVRVECHYKRTHFVSSDDKAAPTLQPPPTIKTPTHFSFQLMSDDWGSKRPSSVYQPGDVMNIQASVINPEHVSVKLFLDSCVATFARDMESEPRYPLIQNHGCPADPSLAPSSICFLPRTKDHVLQMQVDVLPFCRDEQNSAKSIYITCFLKVSDATLGENSMNKACTNCGNSWKSVDGHHEVCECCDSTCDFNQWQSNKWSQWTDNTLSSDTRRSAVMTLGPVIVVN